MGSTIGSLFDAARACLDADTPEDKLARTAQAAADFAEGKFASLDDEREPDPIRMPGRPARPRLVHPRELPRRGFGSNEGRAAFIHAVAHIEFNAIDLAWDAVYRFRQFPADYYRDWVNVAADEARHFAMLRARLQEFGHDYGDFDAHNGLWEMAEKTAHDALARMALVPRVLEARGLDVTPGMIEKLRALSDDATADILEVILREEVVHVAAGSRWFRWCCEVHGCEPRAKFRDLLTEYARPVLYGPFNVEARSAAGFDDEELATLQQLDAKARQP
ncbi:ferritin-like domain-containing protein [Lysobacter sp. A6]|uniref:Ferritin-like domain-containing protein n=1 Tax=Noviluteimonas lactosilytica TaxID=2888523 RepID=A0ABS8JF78_9GAMM|nr:ferritin-like domain-containing protein [Lysobacter lactosilyticus]MCC8362270.1 ferritin-like domain-containing protein [Lysobacter lactosilyticus]